MISFVCLEFVVRMGTHLNAFAFFWFYDACAWRVIITVLNLCVGVSSLQTSVIVYATK